MADTRKVEKKSGIRIVQFKSYVRPATVESQQDDWVLNGVKNSFYQEVIDRYDGSPTNAAIINSYIDLIYGRGLTNKNGRVADFLTFKRMLANEDIRRFIMDFVIFGEAIFQIVKANKETKLPTVFHLPKQDTAPQKVNEKTNRIDGYYYCTDWSDTYKNVPEFMAILGQSDTKTEVVPLRPYKAGRTYFSDPDYLAGMPYAEMEEEMANYYVNHIQNGLSFGYVINIPDGNSYSEEEKDDVEKDIKQKLTGSSNAGKFVINFNGGEAPITIDNVEVNDAHSQWQYLTEESRQQLLTAHRVTSPMLFGIKDNTGLGNNAEELVVAEQQLLKRVIQPKQQEILDTLTSIAEFYELSLDLAFKPLVEHEALEEKKAPTGTITFEEEVDPQDQLLFDVLDTYAEDADSENWELNATEFDMQPIAMSASENSYQDTKIWKVRYAYAKGTRKVPEGKSRAFCRKMVQLEAQGKVFRKEDIEDMSKNGVNGEFAHSGGKYDIFLYGGGVNCYHRWERRIYKKKRKKDGEPYGGSALANTSPVNVSEARRQGFKPEKNNRDVAIAEIDKANHGAYPTKN